MVGKWNLTNCFEKEMVNKYIKKNAMDIWSSGWQIPKDQEWTSLGGYDPHDFHHTYFNRQLVSFWAEDHRLRP